MTKTVWCSAQVSGERDFFAEMVVDAVSALDVETLDMSLLGVKKVSRPAPGTQTSWPTGMPILPGRLHGNLQPELSRAARCTTSFQ